MSLRGLAWLFVGATFWFAVAQVPILAAEDSKETKSADAKKVDNPHGKKAETDKILEANPELGIWTIVVFVLLLLVLRKFAWGPMLEGLHKREDTINRAIEEGKLTRIEMEQLRARNKAEMDEAFAQIPQMIEEARRNGDKLVAERLAKADEKIKADTERVKRELEAAGDRLMQDLTNQTAQLATLISANVLARTLTPEDHNRLLALAVEELKTSGQSMRQEV